ncbi:MAG TPA: hypothetical protein VKA18_14790, partial [Alphaproteobacteria bacterium]|nr:hypothetical protein [Alphaproteobacteria bacterium]
MNRAADPFQRDEVHLFIAVLLHLTVGLVIYALMAAGQPKPRSVTLDGLPILFGEMVSSGQQDGDGTKTLARSTPSEAAPSRPDTRAVARSAPEAGQSR